MKTNDLIYACISGITILLTFTWFGIQLFVTVPPSNSAMINTAGGAILSAGLIQMYNYWFGSSKGSTNKNDTIDSMHNTISDMINKRDNNITKLTN
jgi:hypothetical protein